MKFLTQENAVDLHSIGRVFTLAVIVREIFRDYIKM